MYGSRILGLALGLVAIVVSGLFSYYHITVKFIFFSALLAGLSFFCFVKSPTFYFPKNKIFTYLFASVLFFTALSAFARVPAERITGFSHILISLLTLFASLSLAINEKVEKFVERFVLAQTPIYTFMFCYLGYNALIIGDKTQPFFGNTNITANFVLIACLQFFFISLLTEKKSYKAFSYLMTLIGFMLLVYLKSRAALCGAFLGFSYAIANSKTLNTYLSTYSKTKYFKILLSTIGLILLGGLILAFYSKGLTSMQFRLSFWINSLCMIKDHPLGIGPGAFEYVFQNYNGKCYPSAENIESLIIDHPHNMFVEFIAEIGIPGALALFSLFAVALRKCIQKKTSTLIYSQWLLSSLLALFPIAFFEFPQGTAFTLFYLSVILGVMLSLHSSQIKLPSFTKIAHLSLSLILFFIFLAKGASDYLTVYPGNNERFLGACSLNKENWRGCSYLALRYISDKDYPKAAGVIDELSKRFEGHISLMHLRGTLAEELGDISEACKQYKLYDEVYLGKSSKEDFLTQHCNKK